MKPLLCVVGFWVVVIPFLYYFIFGPVWFGAVVVEVVLGVSGLLFFVCISRMIYLASEEHFNDR